MKKITLLLGLLVASVAYSQNGLDSIIVEKFYISDAADAAGSISASAGTLPAGSVTYRIYASMKPGYKFQALFGVPTHELKLSTTTSFFNNEDRGATSPNGISVTNTRKNTVYLDSWFSVGATATGKMGVLKTEDTDGALSNTDGLLQNADAWAGIPLTSQDGMIAGTPEVVTFVGLTTELDVFDAMSQQGNLFSTTNGSVASLNGSVGPTSSNRVLIGQFTTDGHFCYELNVQIGTPSGGTQQYVAKNPTGNEIHIPSMMGCIGTSVSIKDQPNSVPSYGIYPNPVNDLLTISIDNAVENMNNSYTVYGVLGNVILQKNIGTVSGKYQEKIDLSALESGLYFIELSLNGTTSTKKIIKN